MAKKKKTVSTDVMAMTNHDIQVLRNDYRDMLETEPKYSLNIDPEKKYKFTEEEATFIKQYIDYRNLEAVASLMDIDMDRARCLYMNGRIQSEIRRLNLALYHYQFNQKMMDLDELGGFLTSQLIGDGVPRCDQLSPKEKLKCAEILKDLNIEIRKGIQNPGDIIVKDFETELKDLSVETISQLINQSEKMKDKDSAISEIEEQNNQPLSYEEKAFLKTLSSSELLDILNQKSSSAN